MKMTFIPRVAVLFLSVTLSPSNSAFALRVRGVDSPNVQAEIRAGLEEHGREFVDDSEDTPEIVVGEFTVIRSERVRTIGANPCVICAIYQPDQAGPGLLAHIDRFVDSYPESYRRMIKKLREARVDLSSVIVELIGATNELSVKDIARIRAGLNEAFLQDGGTALREVQIREDVKPLFTRNVVLDANVGKVFNLRPAGQWFMSPIAKAARTRISNYSAARYLGLRSPLEYFEISTTGLEEEGRLVRAMADPEVLVGLEQHGWAKVSGGFVAEADLSTVEPLVLQKGLNPPERLPKSVSVISADETTVVGMIHYLSALALRGGYNVAFSTEYFDLRDAQAAIPITQPMPGSALIAPGMEVQANELGAAFVISKRTGTIYVIGIVMFTSPNWKKPLLYLRVQA